VVDGGGGCLGGREGNDEGEGEDCDAMREFQGRFLRLRDGR
jgi:hypothetical protein